MQLDPAKFNRLLADMGQRCLWRQAELCPCRNPHSGAADPECPVCGGRGTFWGQALRAHTGLTSMRVAREWSHFGMWESGDVVLSVPSDSPLYTAAENDMVVLTDSEAPFSATYTRAYPDERFPPYLTAIEKVSVIVEGAIEARAKPPISENGGAPVWPATGGPDIGQQYSIRARRRPTFFIFKNLPQDRAHHNGRPLPRRVAARLLDLFGK